MEHISELYKRKFLRKVDQYNKHLPLPAYFDEMIGDKRGVTIAEIGAGPINTIGNYHRTADIRLYVSDVLWPEYQELWKQHNVTPLVPIEYQDFENLKYPDNAFDIVHCVNALDHTEKASRALHEIERVCKPGGWIYLRHSPNQKKRFGGHHFWNIYMDGEYSVYESKDEKFVLQKPTHVMQDGLIVTQWKKI